MGRGVRSGYRVGYLGGGAKEAENLYTEKTQSSKNCVLFRWCLVVEWDGDLFGFIYARTDSLVERTHRAMCVFVWK